LRDCPEVERLGSGHGALDSIRHDRRSTMHVIVHHRITDRDKFLATDPGDIAGNAPPDAQVRYFLPARDASAADCLWEAESVGQLRDYLDAATRGICENTYFEVASESALGLPETATSAA
jgi:hypothetical protein